jgi:RNA polymerase sigma-70 factor (ECF subfamily)
MTASTVEAVRDPRRAARPGDEQDLLAGLRAGDEQAFVELLDRYHSSLVRVATVYVGSRQEAEEVAQETWLAVLRGLDRFEGRSSLRTWIFHILVNRARTWAARTRRCIPLSALDGLDQPFEPAVEPEGFLPADHPRWPGHWALPPTSWGELPESQVLGQETLDVARAAIEALPPAQRQVISLRDVEGWSSEEVCALLEVSAENQRVLLHRARSRVRRALDAHLAGAA